MSELHAMSVMFGTAAKDMDARRRFEARDFEDAAQRLHAIARRVEIARQLLRRAVGALRDVERVGVSRVLVEIAELDNA